MARTQTMAGLALAVLLLLTACGSKSEPYGRIHDASVSGDGARIVLLVESGDSALRGSSFAGTWSYRAQQLAVWQLDRASGELTMVRGVPAPAGFDGRRERPTLAQWSAEDVGAEQLPVCDTALGACAVARAPQAFLTHDLRGGVDNGLKLVDGVSGVMVRMEQGRLVNEALAARDATEVASAADSAMRESLRQLFAIAVKQLKQSLAADGSYPSERSATYIDSALSAQHEGLRAEYYLDAGGVLVAKAAEGEAQAAHIRWRPSQARKSNGMPQSFDCETDSAAVTRWVPECKLAIAQQQTMDPELAYVMSRSAELKQSALADKLFQQARRGVSFGVRRNDRAAGQAWLACVGLPASRVGGCDIEHGDTPCAATLPLLCIEPDTHAKPNDKQHSSDQRPMAARVAATARVSGESLPTVATADARCAADFGPEWRLARWTDQGENLSARGDIDAQSRLWIDVPQHVTANCWTR